MQTLTAFLRSATLPRSETLALATHVTGRQRETLLAHPEQAFDPDEAARLRAAIVRRARGEPLAYIVGFREFFGRRFAVEPTVLIPRHETELLVERAIARLAASRAVRDPRPFDVLELGTGCGIVAITIALECPDVAVVATDRSRAALEVARSNGIALEASVRWVESDWFAFLDPGDASSAFDLVVSNPPYVAANDPHLDRGDLRHEPREALTDGADGLQALRTIAFDARRWLRDDAQLLLEHGHDQAATVRALLEAAGYTAVASWTDLAGIERVTVGQRPARGFDIVEGPL